MMGVESIKKQRLNAVQKRGIKLKYVTEITKENIVYCKELMKISEVRHADGVKGNFEVSDAKEYVATATLQKEKPVAQLIYSNVIEIVEQQQYVFDTLWGRAIPAEEKIREIEEGIKPDITDVIRNPGEILKLELGILESAFHEIEIIFSTANVFHIQERLGILQVLRNAAEKDNIKIRILTPLDKSIEQKLQDLKKLKNFDFREIASNFEIKTETVVVDRNYSLVMELKDSNSNSTNSSNANNYLSASSNDIFNKQIGVAIYSNSEPIALCFASIFDSLWQQSNLVEQLKLTDRVKEIEIEIETEKKELSLYLGCQ
jgi:two-component system, OmpR family, sensor histidine kinase VicK